ncbi:MAG: hypothetical protein IJX04_02785, partial [Oscillospiraceae bacterium]|nr:hypothetical protein [Oscillospiraceae bacterium]
PQGENLVISLREIRKTTFFGGRSVIAPTILTVIVHILSSPGCFTNTKIFSGPPEGERYLQSAQFFVAS